MPLSLIYVGIMLATICIWFMLFKRPVYEGVFVSFLILVLITGNIGNISNYFIAGISSSLIYSMIAFVSMSIILTKTKVIDDCIAIILSVCGRITGGAGYAAVVASSFMGALSGSGPGNVMATGSITIPAMKRSGFPAELAANIESNSSYLGNLIPPSSNIVAAMGAFAVVYPTLNITTGQFWMVLWGIAIYFIIQRIAMVWAFCKYYKVKPMTKEELPSLRATIKAGWKGLLLPVIILAPFVIDFLFKDTLFTQKLGETGAKYFSSSILLFIGGISAIYACLISKDKKVVRVANLAKTFSNSIKTIAPAISVCIFGYMIGELFSELNVSEELGAVISSLSMGKFGIVVVICIITCFLGMAIPGSSLVVIFGPVFITTLANVGVDPLLAAAMLPCICGVMCGITPPMALGMYAGMTIAESDFSKTVKNDLWWVAAQFVLQVVILMGWLPILGL